MEKKIDPHCDVLAERVHGVSVAYVLGGWVGEVTVIKDKTFVGLRSGRASARQRPCK